jgi:hypothetical protein
MDFAFDSRSISELIERLKILNDFNKAVLNILIERSARYAHPERWCCDTRNWKWIDRAQLNSDQKILIQIDEGRLAA